MRRNRIYPSTSIHYSYLSFYLYTLFLSICIINHIFIIRTGWGETTRVYPFTFLHYISIIQRWWCIQVRVLYKSLKTDFCVFTDKLALSLFYLLPLSFYLFFSLFCVFLFFTVFLSLCVNLFLSPLSLFFPLLIYLSLNLSLSLFLSLFIPPFISLFLSLSVILSYLTFFQLL